MAKSTETMEGWSHKNN